MKEKFQKLNNWYVGLNTKQRVIIWALSLPYAIFPPTGVLLGGIPWALILLYMEYNRNSNKNN
ncbi:MAG TPA: hypothetical protein ENO02_08285 [Epsilonproteobacteria bacterium]|nr:hypothetical protein [Campylobacterota bacterium]